MKFQSNSNQKLLLKFFAEKFLFTVLILFSTIVQAKTYYVSATGNNSNDGLSPSTAWQTIAKVNSFNFAANDYILFNRGNTFYGGIIVKIAGLNFGAYGSGAKPIISGLSTVTGWVNLGGNIWEAPVTNVKKGVNLVLRNDIIQQVGRYPNVNAANGGYLTYTASTTSSITGPAQSSTTNWTGAELVLRPSRWEIRRQIITSHSGGVVSFAANSSVPRVDFGYFFQRDKRTLDLDGEWWHDAVNNKLRMYFGNNNPSSYTFQVATVDTLFKCLYGNLVLSDISFNGSGDAAVWTNGNDNVTIKNCDVNNSGAEAISTKFSTNVLIDNCTATNSLGSGIRVYNTAAKAVNLTVKNCTIINSAYIAGMETSSEFNGGAGISSIGGNGITIQNNIIKNCGYIAIEWQGNDILIKNNFLDTYCLLRDDGGGIYTCEKGGSTLPTRTNRKIIGNIVINGIGNNNGTADPKGRSASGIYFDLGTRTVFVDSNTVINQVGNGMHGNNIADLTITNNTTFNCYHSFSTQRFSDANLVRGMRITHNIFYPYIFWYRNAGIDYPTLITKEQDFLAMGKIDSNYYSTRAGADTSLDAWASYHDYSNAKQTYNNFGYITGTVKQETHSINVANNGTIEYNASNTPKVVSFSGLSKKDVYGNVYNNSVTIQAWKSIVLIPNGTATTTNKAPVANAGADKTITLPTNTTNLSGTGTDTDGTIGSYAWLKISGPTTGTIATPNTASTSINSLVEGVYKYELTVTDDLGAVDKDTVQITVNSATALPPPTLLPAVNPANTVNGLDYKYYEGNWSVLPAFSSLTPIETGSVSNFSLTPANRSTQYGFEFSGYINVPSDGSYTFYTSSDDGSALYIDNVLTVSNDGIHGSIEKSGVIGLKAGKHLIKGLFFQQTGGGAFTVSYAGNGVVKQAIPASAIFRDNLNLLPAVNPANTVNGLDYKYYEGNWSVLPAFSSLTPVETGSVSNFSLTPANRSTQYGFEFTGYINVPSDGVYTFYTSSDDGSALYIDNVLTVSNDGIHGAIEKSGVIGLKAGKHLIKVLFFEQASNEVLTVSYAGNGIGKQTIPSSSLFRTATTARLGDLNSSMTQTNIFDSVNTTEPNRVGASDKNRPFKINTFPNPFLNEFTLNVQGGTSEKLTILVVDAAGRTVYQSIGSTDNKYKLGDNFVRGLYIIKVIQGNNVQTLKIIKI